MLKITMLLQPRDISNVQITHTQVCLTQTKKSQELYLERGENYYPSTSELFMLQQIV